MFAGKESTELLSIPADRAERETKINSSLIPSVAGAERHRVLSNLMEKIVLVRF